MPKQKNAKPATEQKKTSGVFLISHDCNTFVYRKGKQTFRMSMKRVYVMLIARVTQRRSKLANRK